MTLRFLLGVAECGGFPRYDSSSSAQMRYDSQRSNKLYAVLLDTLLADMTDGQTLRPAVNAYGCTDAQACGIICLCFLMLARSARPTQASPQLQPSVK